MNDVPETDIVRLGGNETVMLGGGFMFQGGTEQLVVNMLPPFMHIPAEQPASAVLRETLAMLDRELEQSSMGEQVMMVASPRNQFAN